MRKPSIWYWVICVLALVWNGFGAADYLAYHLDTPAYEARMEADAVSYFNSLPGWLMWAWALAVWGGILGWVLMLLRSRFALPAFVVSLVAMVINFGYWIPTGGLSIMPVAGLVVTAFVVAGAVFAVWFARRARAKGTLR